MQFNCNSADYASDVIGIRVKQRRFMPRRERVRASIFPEKKKERKKRKSRTTVISLTRSLPIHLRFCFRRVLNLTQPTVCFRLFDLIIEISMAKERLSKSTRERESPTEELFYSSHCFISLAVLVYYFSIITYLSVRWIFIKLNFISSLLKNYFSVCDISVIYFFFF